MDKLDSVWIVSTKPSTASEICTAAAGMGKETILFYYGKREDAVGANTTYYMDAGPPASFLNYIPKIVELVCQARPQLVMIEVSRNGRAVAAALAAALGTAVLTDLSSLSIAAEDVIGERMVYGGEAFQKIKAEGKTVVATVGNGVFEAGERHAATKVIDIDPVRNGINLVERREKTASSVNLATSKRIVSGGRGIGKQENLEYLRSFAKAIDADIGCSRPLAEEESWLPVECFVGISGVTLKADVYIAVAISGQIQHMVGANQSKVIVAINKDKNARIFKYCDYGIVGDFEKVLPALTDKFSQSF